MRLLWCPVPLERGAGRGRIRAKRKECQQGLWKDTLQSEHLVGLEGLTEWDKGSESVCNCVWECVLFYYTKILFLDMQSENLPKIHLGFGFRLEGKQKRNSISIHCSSSWKKMLELNKCAKKKKLKSQNYFWQIHFSRKINQFKPLICAFRRKVSMSQHFWHSTRLTVVSWQNKGLYVTLHSTFKPNRQRNHAEEKRDWKDSSLSASPKMAVISLVDENRNEQQFNVRYS